MKFWWPVIVGGCAVMFGLSVANGSPAGGWLAATCGWTLVCMNAHVRNDCIHCCED